MTSDRLVPLTRAGLVAQRLREMVDAGELRPGTLLRQAEIAERFGVSTTPVREAFAVLMREGVVQQHAHRSVVVFEPAAEELKELYEIRSALEPLAARLAAEHITDDEVADLEAIIAEMATATAARYLELNGVLHDTIYRIAARPRLFEILSRLRTTSANYAKLTVGSNGQSDPGYRADVHRQHEEIVAALKARDGDLCAEIVREHLQTTLDHLGGLVDATHGEAR